MTQNRTPDSSPLLDFHESDSPPDIVRRPRYSRTGCKLLFGGNPFRPRRPCAILGSYS